MKNKPTVLWLYHPASYGDSRSLSNRIHFGFIKRLEKHTNLYIYGPSETEENGTKLSPMPFNGRIPIRRVISYFNPDIILIYTYGTVKRWIPDIYDAFQTIKCPKLYIEVDYYTLKGPAEKKWYLRNGFNFVQRGYYEDAPEESVWLPFSADEELLKFQHTLLKDRKQEISFTGRYRWLRKEITSHHVRAKAISILQEGYDFRVNGDHGIVGHEEYPKAISSSLCALSDCCDITNSPPAKMFEIMAVKTLLLTTKLDTKKVLFGNNKLYYEYEKDCSNITEVAQDIISGDRNMQQDMVNKAAEIIEKKHLHEHRINELLEIMDATIKGKKMPKKWGH